jgi:predicted metalloprotease with PDZ domain
MKISKYFLLVVLLFSFKQVSATDGKYVYKIDLTNVVDDKVYVELTVPDIDGDMLIFHLPKMIPGTYAIEDYGRFVSEFKAIDKKGKSLPVEQASTNSWKISKAKKLVTISYWIEDSFDTELEGPEIFQPAGTNIEEGRNFIINSSGFFGFFEGHTDLNYEITVIKPQHFYGSTGLIPLSVNNALSTSLKLAESNVDTDATVDVFATTNYDELVDSPIMYSLPDTTILDVAGTQVLVSSYSPNKVITAIEIANTIKEVLLAQKDYLGGKLPVDKYAFIFYFTDEPIMLFGALEHSYSSLYYIPENTIDELEQQLRDFAAHEFFHIVTPLSIHSEEIQPFDFINPKMSKHLWLYEGMTEYFAGNAQVKAGLISVDEYINMLREKMFYATEFNDTLPLTELSLGALDTYASQYMNIYQKGALVGLSLDLTLLELSGGEYGVQEMMADLAKEYGKYKAFKDEELFDKITELTYPEVSVFFSKYVEGNEPLPMADIFLKAGVTYEDEGEFWDYSLGLTNENFGIDMDRGVLYVQHQEKLDDFGKALGLKDGDIMLSINGDTIPQLGPQILGFFENVITSMVEGREYSMTVLRSNTDGVEEKVTLATKTIKVKSVVPYAIRPVDKPTELQLKVRSSWLGLE